MPDDGALGDRGMVAQRALHLERADSVLGADDHVVGATHEPEAAVLVARGAVAREIPGAPERALGLLGGAPVVVEQGRRPPLQADLTGLSQRHLAAVLVDHGDVMPGDRDTQRPGLQRA